MIISPKLAAEIKASEFYQNLLSGSVEIDNSTFINWDGCLMKGIIAGALKRVPSRANPALAFGSAIHKGLEALHEGKSIDDSMRYALAEAELEGLDRVADDRRNTQRLEMTLRGYAADYALRAEKFNPITLDGIPLIEQSFSFPIANITIQPPSGLVRGVTVNWSGKIDMIAEYKGEIWVVDHKTTSQMGEKFADDKHRSSQFLGYIWAARHFAEKLDIPVAGVVINAIITTKEIRYDTFELFYPDWKIDEWLPEIRRKLELTFNEFLQAVEKQIVIPTREHCVTKYGKCPYFDVCELQPRARDSMLLDEDFFTISTWSPHD